MIIDNQRAMYLAYEYKKYGDLEGIDLFDLLNYILHSMENQSFEIANIAFSKDDIKKGFDNNSPLSKLETIGFFHPSEINSFLFYYKWSLNNDAVQLRRFANYKFY